MGDYLTEMILEGILCESCGDYLGDKDEKPYAHKCAGCEGEE